MQIGELAGRAGLTLAARVAATRRCVAASA